MRLAYVIAVSLIVAAPFIGRWRANVYLKKHLQTRTPAEATATVKAA